MQQDMQDNYDFLKGEFSRVAEVLKSKHRQPYGNTGSDRFELWSTAAHLAQAMAETARELREIKKDESQAPKLFEKKGL